MAHHSGGPMSQKFLDQLLGREQNLGATKQFPQGKIDPTDEGEIRLAIGHKDGKVIVDFGTKVVWIGFDPKQARELAATIIKHADEVEGK